MPFQIRSTGINAGLPSRGKPNNPFAPTGSGFSLAGVDTGGVVGDDFPFELEITYDATANTLQFDENKLITDNDNSSPISKLIRDCLNLYTIQISQNGQVLSGFIPLDLIKEGNEVRHRTLTLDTSSFNSSAPVSLTLHIGFNPSYLDSAERIRHNFTRNFSSLSAMNGQTIAYEPNEAIGELAIILNGVEYANEDAVNLPDVVVGEQAIIEPILKAKNGPIMITQIGFRQGNINSLTRMNFCLHLKEDQSTFKGWIQGFIKADSVGAKSDRVVINTNQSTFSLNFSYNVV